MLALDNAALARLMIGATRIRASERGRWLEDSRPQARPAATPATRRVGAIRLKICFLVFGSTGSSPVAATKSLDIRAIYQEVDASASSLCKGGSPAGKQQGNRNTPRGRQRQRAHRRGDEPSLKATAGQITVVAEPCQQNVNEFCRPRRC